jgi:hypothetical protein
MITYTWEAFGFTELSESISRLEKETIEAAAKEEVLLAKRIVKEIKEKYVPIYIGKVGKRLVGMKPTSLRFGIKTGIWRKNVSGVLRDSVDCDVEATIDPNGITVSIWAGKEGSGAEAYAAIQHENLMYKHRVGQAKYIEVPVNLIGGEQIRPSLMQAVSTAFSNWETYAPGAFSGAGSPGGTGLL